MIFANKSSTHISVGFLGAFCNLQQSGGFYWGAAALTHMYDNLNYASKHKGKHLAGYISFLQAWIYEHFPSIRSMIEDERYDESRSRARLWECRKALSLTTYRRWLDRLVVDAVVWMPYAKHCVYVEFQLISLFSGHIK